MKKYLLSLSLLAIVAANAQTAKRPLMGWASFNNYRKNISDSLFRAQADAMASSGLLSVGYKYVNVDDFFTNGRDAAGNLRTDTVRFPFGMKPLADYIHGKGLKAGIYTDAGPNTCGSIWDGITGGVNGGCYNYEQKDMDLFFKTWGYDYVKVDYCGASQQSLKLDEKTQYTKILNAIINTGVPNWAYNICRWQFPGTWVTSVGDSWRIHGDINANWGSITAVVDDNTYTAAYMTPGHYNDMDMLQVGRGMSFDEDKTHFSMWCILTSPLVLGNDMTNMSTQTLSILKNTEAIAINQDTTEQGHLVSDYQSATQVWVKKLNGKQSGDRAVVLLNKNTSATNITVNFADIDLGATATVRDIWNNQNKGSFTTSYTASVPAHGVVLLKVQGSNVNATTYEAEYAYLNNYNLTQNTVVVANQGKPAFITTASKGAIATSLGSRADNYIEFRDIYVDSTGKYPLSISYLSATNRTATMKVNNVVAATGNFNSGSSSSISRQHVFVNLVKGNNTIRFENATAALPDFDKISLGKLNDSLPVTQITLEAEEAVIADATIVNNSNASKGKMVDNMTRTSSITFNSINVLQSGIYPIKISYASATNKTLTIALNGVPTVRLFNLNTGGANIVKDTVVDLRITQNNNSIKLYFNAGDAPAIDKIYYDIDIFKPLIQSYEAEQATLIQGTQGPKVVNDGNCSNGQKVGFLGVSSAAQIIFTNVKVTQSGVYPVKIYYLSGENRPLTVVANGVTTELTNLNSGGWGTVKPVEFNANLRADTVNVITLFHATAWTPDVDKIEIDHSRATLTPLSVTLKSFEAYKAQNNVQLNWKVSNEANIGKYIVEHSINNTNFTKINEQLARNHNNTESTYTTVHNSPVQGVNYYRLSSVSTTGNLLVLASTAVNNTANLSALKVYPNPANSFLNIASPLTSEATIFDTSGKLVKVLSLQQGLNLVNIQQIPTGNYYIISGNLYASFIKK